jgi:hypothetical protein
VPDSANTANMAKHMQPSNKHNRPLHGDRESDHTEG